MVTPSAWLQWQLIDSAFPAGAFAHSGGLEVAVQLGLIAGPEQLTDFVNTSLRQTARFAAPFAIAAATGGDFDELETACHAMLANDVANRASREQGKAFVMTASEIWPEVPIVHLRGRLRQGDAHGHFCVCFGFVAASLQFDVRQTAEMLLFNHARGLLSAAVRLGVLGTLAAQRVQTSLVAVQEESVGIALATSIENASQTAPLLDLLQSQHARLYSRLFLS